jgi:outer membrane lipoprotein-sorting protein
MTRTHRRRLRYAVAPAALAAGVATAVVVSSVTAAAAHPRLPRRTAAQLLVAVEKSNVTALSGTIKDSTHLGLPDLPELGGLGSGLSIQRLLIGTHTLRVWADGPERQRLALLGQLAETDVIHNGRDLWTFDSQTLTVTHTRLPASKSDAKHASDPTEGTPLAAAAAALKAIDPTTRVTVDRTARVAGRPAYQLVLTPRDSRTLIARIVIAIDAKRSVPLRVQVFARGATHAAIDIGFTSVHFGRPDPARFVFHRPAHTTLRPLSAGTFGVAVPKHEASMPRRYSGYGQTHSGGLHFVQTLGKGWTSVAEFDGDTSMLGGQLKDLTTPVAGGRLLTTQLVTALVTDDGHVYVGAVPGSALQQVASTGRGL